MKIVRRKKKDGTQIDASSRGVDGARVEISHPQWMNATTIGGNGKTGLILQNGTKLENDYKTKIKRIEFSDGLTLETEESKIPETPLSKKRTLWYTLGIPALSAFFVARDTTGIPFICLPYPASASASAAAAEPFERLSVHQFTSRLAKEDIPLQVRMAKDQSIQFIHKDSTEVEIRNNGEIQIQVKQGTNVTRAFTDKENIVTRVNNVNTIVEPTQIIVVQDNQVQNVVTTEKVVTPLNDGREIVQPAVGDAQVVFANGNVEVPVVNQVIQNGVGDEIVVVDPGQPAPPPVDPVAPQQEPQAPQPPAPPAPPPPPAPE